VRSLPAVLLGGLLLVSLGPGDVCSGGDDAEWVRSYLPYLPDTVPLNEQGQPTMLAIRVMTDDGVDTVPVAGASVSAWTEELKPTALESRKLGEGKSDEYGIANVTWKDGNPHHWVVEAPGRGTTRWGGGPDGLACEDLLPEGVTKRVRLLGPMGDILVGAKVELFHGCPHSPTLRSGITDAKGIVVFEDLPEDPHAFQMRIDAPGVRSKSSYWLPWPRARVGEGDLPPTLVTEPGHDVEGQVLDPDGRPLAGIIVREILQWRGSVAMTDARGRFLLRGVGESCRIAFYHPDAPFGERPSALVLTFSADVPLRVVLRRDRPNDPANGEPRHTVDVEALVRWPKATMPGHFVPVTLTRLADGFTIRGGTGQIGWGFFTAQVPPGEYRITAGGGFSGMEAASETVSVPRADARTVRFVLERQSRPDIRGRWRTKEETASFRIPGAMSLKRTLSYLPANSRAALVLDGSRVFPFGPTKNGRREVVIPPSEVVEISARVRTEDETVESYDIEVNGTIVDWKGRWSAKVAWAGAYTVVATAPDHKTERRIIEIPPTPGKIDLGEILLRKSSYRTFSIVDAKGNPVLDADMTFDSSGSDFDHPWASKDDDGTFFITVGPRPDPWIVEGDGRYPTRVELSHTSPAEIRIPAGRVTVTIQDGAGKTLEPVGCLDALRFEVTDGVLDLRGVPDGPHTLILGARGHMGEVRRIVLKDGEHRRITTSLPPRTD
jgi:hypothetical protein